MPESSNGGLGLGTAEGKLSFGHCTITDGGKYKVAEKFDNEDFG